MKKILTAFIFSLFVLGLPVSCGVNVFTVEDDIALGTQVDQEIESNPGEYPILKEDEFPEAYAYIKEIRDEILRSGEVEHEDDFEWQIHILQDDTVLNAFATPGGFLYFYTGLIKFLDEEDHFAGVMGHEIAHAARRHSTEAMTAEFGVDLLLQAVLGNDAQLIQDIALGLGSLAFSRDNESEADRFSVLYLSKTRYACDGVAGFFQKLIDQGDSSNPPEFLSTHPNPENRVQDIQTEVDKLNCSTVPSGRDYQAFKDLLP